MIFRGDTFNKTITVTLDGTTPYEFVVGDRIKTCFVKGKTYNEKEIVIEAPTEAVKVSYSSEEMQNVELGKNIFEVEVQTGSFVKTYQQLIEIERDYIDGKY